MASRLTRLLVALAASAAVGTIASAAPITGTLNFTGTITVSGTSDNFSANGVNNLTVFQLPATGGFAGVVPGSTGAITNITSSNSTIDASGFPPFQWVTVSNGTALDLNFIPLDTSTPVCGAGAGNGTTCRAAASSPIILSQSNGNTTATLTVDGTARSATDAVGTGAPFVGTISTQFVNQSISDVLASFAQAGGSISASYSATVVAAATSQIPEPATLAFLGTGLLGIAVVARRRRA